MPTLPKAVCACIVSRDASSGRMPPLEALGPAPPERILPPALRCLDQQPPAGVLDAGLLGRGHVGLLSAVAGANLDDGVRTVSGHDPDVTDPELHRHGDGFGSIESGHQTVPSVRFWARTGDAARYAVRSVSGPSRCSADGPAVNGIGGEDRDPFVPTPRWLLARASC